MRRLDLQQQQITQRRITAAIISRGRKESTYDAVLPVLAALLDVALADVVEAEEAAAAASLELSADVALLRTEDGYAAAQ